MGYGAVNSFESYSLRKEFDIRHRRAYMLFTKGKCRMAKTKRLSEIIAVEKGIKNRVNTATSELYKVLLKTEKFSGYQKTYVAKNEDGDSIPPERKEVELRAEDVLLQDAKLYTELVDVILTKDMGNRVASADVEVNGTALLSNVPATTLLYLEKLLLDVRSFVERLPVLDAGSIWTYDANARLYRSEPSATNRTKKVEKALVLYDAVVRDGVGIPAQTKTTSEDITIGTYTKVEQCGAMPLPRKEKILARVDELLISVRQARTRANTVEVEQSKIGQVLFDYLLGEK